MRGVSKIRNRQAARRRALPRQPQQEAYESRMPTCLSCMIPEVGFTPAQHGLRAHACSLAGCLALPVYSLSMRRCIRRLRAANVAADLHFSFSFTARLASTSPVLIPSQPWPVLQGHCRQQFPDFAHKMCQKIMLRAIECHESMYHSNIRLRGESLRLRNARRRHTGQKD